METDAAFLLRVLSDGRPHALNEILQRSFAERGCGLTVHSRISSLREKGHTIINERVPGAKRGAGSTYRLVTPPTAACVPYVEQPAWTDTAYECVIDESAGLSEQLELTDSAARHIYRDMASTPL